MTLTLTLAQLAGLFTAPALAVAGVLCLAIPIVIHLLSRTRRKRAEWGAMRFLRLAYKKQKRKLQMERWLLLLARCLIVLIAGLALAGPILSGSWWTGGADRAARTVHIVIDDGLSTRAGSGEGVRFDRLRGMALGLVDGVSSSDAVRVWTTSGQTPTDAAGVERASLDVAGVRRTLNQLGPGYGGSRLEDVLVDVAAAVSAESGAGGREPVVAVLSDFPRGASQWGRALPAELQGLGEKAKVIVARPEVGLGNVQVQRLEPRRSLVLAEAGGSSASIEVGLRRLSDVTQAESATVQVRLSAPDGHEVSQVSRSVAWSPGQSAVGLTVELPLSTTGASVGESAGTWTVEARVTGEAGIADALLEDNTRFAVVQVRQRLNVVVVDESDGGSASGLNPAAFVRAALAPRDPGEGGFAVSVERALPSAVREEALGSVDAVVVLRPDTLGSPAWEALGGFARQGGLVWVFPPVGMSDGSAETPPAWFELMGATFGLDWGYGGVVEEASVLDPDRRPPGELVLLLSDWADLLGPVRVDRYVAVDLTGDDASWVQLRGGGAWVAAEAVGEGRLLWVGSAVDPSWTSLPTKPMFPALMQDALRGVLGDRQRADGGGVVVGDRPTLGRGWSGVTALVQDTARVALEPSADLPGVRALQRLRLPGVYEPETAGRGQRLAVNVPADAGDVRGVSPEEVEAWLAGLGEWEFAQEQAPALALEGVKRQTNLGTTLLWVLLALVVVEMWMARWFSHAATPRRVAAGARAGRRASDGGGRRRFRFKRAAVWLMIGGLSVVAVDAAHAQSWVDGWLGLDRVSVGDAGMTFGWRHELPGWAWVLIASAAAVVSWWSYRHLLGSRWVRYTLAGVRGLLIVLIAVLLAGPEVVRTDETVEQDVLLVLVDRSASMNVADVPVEAGLSLESRDTALRNALQLQGEKVFGPEALGKDRQVAWLGFGEQAFDLPDLAEGTAEGLRPAEAGDTRLRSAIEEGLRRAAGRPISGIVLMSDGRSPEATGSAFVSRLEQASVRVFPVPIGAERLPLDLALARVDPPPSAFINDTVPVTVVVDQPGVSVGDEDAVEPGRVTVRLVDAQTEDVLDEKTLEGVGLGQPLRLEGRSSRPGEMKWKVEVVYNDTSVGATQELNLTNNAEVFEVNLIDRPIRVLYVEGYPRWEYRYLKNMLIREKSIDSSIYLLSADRGFAQEGDTPITRLPASPEEWQRYDVVVMGDVPAEVFSADQRKQLLDLVSQRGAGLLWIAGSHATPGTWSASVLADLLPMRDPESVGVLPWGSAAVAPTALAESLSVLQLSSSEAKTRSLDDMTTLQSSGWPEALPALRWVQELGRIKPTAEVLATVSALSGDAEQPGIDAEPLVTRLRFGAGQSVYVGSDETWRWRYARGEVYFEQFWVQLIRMLGRSAVANPNQQVRFAASARRVPMGGTVVTELVIEDAALLARELPSIKVSVVKPTEADDVDGSVVGELEMRAVDEPGEASGGRRVYRGSWTAGVAGALELRVDEGALAGFDLRLPLEVVSPNDEMRRVEADRERLASLADATGGRVIELTRLDELTEPGLVRNLARKTANDVSEPIWNSALALALVIGLVTLEWIGRKVIRLV